MARERRIIRRGDVFNWEELTSGGAELEEVEANPDPPQLNDRQETWAKDTGVARTVLFMRREDDKWLAGYGYRPLTTQGAVPA